MNTDLTIQEVSDRLGLPKSTIRYWEKELNGLISPMRTPGGQRRYSESDMGVITAVSNYKKMGLSLSQVKKQILHQSLQFQNVDQLQIEHLANRITGVIRQEIYNFFHQGRHQTDMGLPAKAIQHDFDR